MSGRRSLEALAVVAVVALAVVPQASAKGQLAASLDGPGLDEPLDLGSWTWSATGSNDSPVFDFAEAAGFYAAVFATHPQTTLHEPPKGDLGPRYTATYDLGPAGGGERTLLVQDVYPFAKPRPLPTCRRDRSSTARRRRAAGGSSPRSCSTS